jgi:hypothetical protein
MMTYRWLDHLFADSDLDTPEGRARCAITAMECLAQQPMQRTPMHNPHVLMVADRCRLDPARLHRHLALLLAAARHD